MLLILKCLSRLIGSVRGLIGAFLAILAIGTIPVSAGAGDLKVQDIRIGLHSGSTRFVVELNNDVKPRVFGLPDPYRVVIDLPEVDFDLPEERIGDGAGQISRLRYGLFRTGTSRFVLDLKSPSKVIKKFILKPAGEKPWRLVLDLAPTTHADFVESEAQDSFNRTLEMLQKKSVRFVDADVT